jgi:hypothetical protein
MKRSILFLSALAGSALAVQAAGTVWFENYSLSVGIRTNAPSGYATTPLTISFWFLPGATSVPPDVNGVIRDPFGNVVGGGVYAVVGNGYQQITPNFSATPFYPGKFDEGFVSVPTASSSVTQGVFAVVAWTGNYASIGEAVENTAQLGAISFLNPIVYGPSLPASLVGWEEMQQDLVLQVYPIPEPTVLALSGVAIMVALIRSSRR